jgi:cob(I)alamin adenosyltransferase
MDAQSHVEILRLHCEHLRTLLDQVIRELTTIESDLATDGNHSFSIVAPHLNELEKQSAHLAAETRRLQSFMHSLRPQSTDASDTAGESSQSSPLAADTLQVGRCKIV